jgi:hypothetical protein
VHLFYNLQSWVTGLYVYQLLAQGRWFSPGSPASSPNTTGRHDMGEILLRVVFNTKIKKKNQFVLM